MEVISAGWKYAAEVPLGTTRTRGADKQQAQNGLPFRFSSLSPRTTCLACTMAAPIGGIYEFKGQVAKMSDMSKKMLRGKESC